MSAACLPSKPCRSPKDNPATQTPSAGDIAVMLPSDFRLQSGEKLSRPEIQLRLHGDPSRPIVIAAGGISAGKAVAQSAGDAGWWRGLVGEGRAVDTSDYCVIGFDFIPNPGETARTVTTLDQARALIHALDAINIEKVKAFVGASYGGMVGLAFAAAFPVRLEKLCVISAADRAHPGATALRGVQRRIIDLAERCGAGAEGVSLARQLAMVSYRTPEEFAARFAHAPGATAGDPHEVCAYLISRGEAYDMAPARYVTLSDSIDRHTVDVGAIVAPILLLAARSDRLVPAEDVQRVADGVKGARFHAFDSLFGHDAFLKEEAVIGPIIRQFIEETAP